MVINVKIGKIVQISGPVIDVKFEDDALPRIREALSVELNGEKRIMEVAQHVGDGVVRCIMLAGSEGLYRGMEVAAPGSTITGSGRPGDAGADVQRPRRPDRRGRGGRRRHPPRQHLPQSRRLLKTRARSSRSSRPASRSSTCWNPTPRAARSACSAARASARRS